MYNKYPNPNPNGRPLIDCKGCGKRLENGAKGYCKKCYKNIYWKPKSQTCKNCERDRPHQAFGLCVTCYNRLHHYDYIKAYNAKKYYGISLEKLRRFTKKCIVCGFSKIVELHHLDGNRKNNYRGNLVGLCPNCHKMIHSYAFFDEIINILKKKGYGVSKCKPSTFLSERKKIAEENARNA
ncbi:MAG: hypothetical protein ABIB71_04775 [Candidatus Woesearchaeota archaeon]